MAYDDNNVFAKILRGDIPAKKVYEDEYALAFHDIAGKAPVHVLVIPKKHVSDVYAAREESDAFLAGLLRTAAKVAGELGLAESGFRLVSNCGADARQTVPHLHVHILGGKQLGDRMD